MTWASCGPGCSPCSAWSTPALPGLDGRGARRQVVEHGAAHLRHRGAAALPDRAGGGVAAVDGAASWRSPGGAGSTRPSTASPCRCSSSTPPGMAIALGLLWWFFGTLGGEVPPDLRWWLERPLAILGPLVAPSRSSTSSAAGDRLPNMCMTNVDHGRMAMRPVISGHPRGGAHIKAASGGRADECCRPTRTPPARTGGLAHAGPRRHRTLGRRGPVRGVPGDSRRDRAGRQLHHAATFTTWAADPRVLRDAAGVLQEEGGADQHHERQQRARRDEELDPRRLPGEQLDRVQGEPAEDAREHRTHVSRRLAQAPPAGPPPAAPPAWCQVCGRSWPSSPTRCRPHRGPAAGRWGWRSTARWAGRRRPP